MAGEVPVELALDRLLDPGQDWGAERQLDRLQLELEAFVVLVRVDRAWQPGHLERFLAIEGLSEGFGDDCDAGRAGPDGGVIPDTTDRQVNDRQFDDAGHRADRGFVEDLVDAATDGRWSARHRSQRPGHRVEVVGVVHRAGDHGQRVDPVCRDPDQGQCCESFGRAPGEQARVGGNARQFGKADRAPVRRHHRTVPGDQATPGGAQLLSTGGDQAPAHGGRCLPDRFVDRTDGVGATGELTGPKLRSGIGQGDPNLRQR